jgi:hypothetical protein
LFTLGDYEDWILLSSLKRAGVLPFLYPVGGKTLHEIWGILPSALPVHPGNFMIAGYC